MRFAVALVACAACGSSIAIDAMPADVLARAGDRAQLPAGIRVASRGMDCVTTSGAALDAATDRIGYALADYPERVLLASGIAEIEVCAVLARTDAIGLAHLGRNRISVSLEAGAHFADVVHHEVFHMLDHERLEASADLERGRGAVRAWRPRGFVSEYAATNEAEDRATTFEYLMARPDELCAIARADYMVAAKVTAVWAFVARVAGDDRFLRRRAPCVDWIPAAASGVHVDR